VSESERSRVDHDLMAHALNAAEGVINMGQSGPDALVMLIAVQPVAQPTAEGVVEGHVQSLSTAPWETQIEVLEEALRMARTRLVEITARSEPS
jgi:hypothetical protein